MLQEEASKKAKALLTDENGNPTSHYKLYMQYQEEWKNKRKAYDTAYSTALIDTVKLKLL